MTGYSGGGPASRRGVEVSRPFNKRFANVRPAAVLRGIDDVRIDSSTALVTVGRGTRMGKLNATLRRHDLAHHGPNLARLTDVKRRYDPDRVLRFPRAI